MSFGQKMARLIKVIVFVQSLWVTVILAFFFDAGYEVAFGWGLGFNIGSWVLYVGAMRVWSGGE